MRLPMFAAAAALMSTSLSARADTLIENIATGSFVSTNPVILIPFQQFNPALGTLTSLSTTLGGSFTFVAYPFPGTPPDTVTFTLVVGGLLDMFSQNGSVGPTYQTSGSNSTTNPSLLVAVTGHETQDASFIIDAAASSQVSSPNGFSGNITYTYTPLSPTTTITPEPSSFLLLVTGFLGLAGRARHRFLEN